MKPNGTLKKLLRSFICNPTGKLSQLKEYVESGGSVDVLYQKTTALCVAARTGSLESVRYLHSQGADVNQRDTNGCTPLYLAASHGRTDVVEFLLQDCDPDLDVPNKNGYTALVSAVQNGHDNCAGKLITAGASVNVARPDTLGVDIALLSYVLFARGDYRLAERLLQAGVVPYKLTPPLTFLLLEDPFIQCSFVRMLIAAGFEVTCSGWVDLMRCRGDRDLTDRQRELLSMINYEQKHTQSLQRLCRVAVRKSLAYSKGQGHFYLKVSKLPLPEEVKKYVTMEYL